MKSAIRDHVMFPGCDFFLQTSVLFHILILLLGLSILPVPFYLALLTSDPCWPLKLHTLSLSPTFVQPLQLAPQVVPSPPDQSPEDFEMANELFSLVSSLASGECVMCSSGLVISHVTKGWTFLMWTGPLFFLFPWAHSLCFLLVPVSGGPSCGQQWKRSRSVLGMQWLWLKEFQVRLEDVLFHVWVKWLILHNWKMNDHSHFPTYSR